jgi:hypothetical protein
MQIQSTGMLRINGSPKAPVVKGWLTISESNIDLTNVNGAAADVQPRNPT